MSKTLTAAHAAALAGAGSAAEATRVDASGQGLEGVESLESMAALVRLDLSDNALTSIEGAGAAPNLRWLSAARNHVSSLDALRGLGGSLSVLNASHNRLAGAAKVGRLRALRALVLNNNPELRRVSGLDRLPELNSLVLSHCGVDSLSGWLGVGGAGAALAKLSLSHNAALAELPPALSALTSLKELRVGHCALPALPGALTALRRLRILEAGGNPIERLSAVEVLGDMPGLAQLSLRGAPLAARPGYREKVLALAPGLATLDGRRAGDAGEGGAGGAARGEESAEAAAAPRGGDAEAPPPAKKPKRERREKAAPAAPVPAKAAKAAAPAAAAEEEEDDDALPFLPPPPAARARLDPGATGAVKIVEAPRAGRKKKAGATGAGALAALLADEAPAGWD
jgi:Leucine-rich repeat (LRR) protein